MTILSLIPSGRDHAIKKDELARVSGQFRPFYPGTIALLVTAASWSSTMSGARRAAVTRAAGVVHPGGYGSDA